MPGISGNFPHSLPTVVATGKGMGAFGGFTHSMGPSSTHISRDSVAGGQGTPVLQIDIPLSHLLFLGDW